MAGTTFVSLIVGQQAQALASGGLVAAGVLAAGHLAKRRRRALSDPVIPDSRISFHSMFDVLTEFFVKLGDDVMGRENRKYLPFIGALFTYLLIGNLLGMVPGFTMPTDSLKFNLGVAVVVFVLYNYWGVREVGVKAYLKHFWGPFFALGFLLFPIELISHAIRPLSLSLRLFGNMTGDHMVLQVFTDLTKFGIPVIFYIFGTFVCFVQAFVFTLLAMVYISLAVTHEESH